MLTDEERNLFEQLKQRGVEMPEPSWEKCRAWLNDNEWKINVLSDYPRGEVKFTVRRGFERIELTGRSDLEVMARALLEITRRTQLEAQA